MPSRRQPKWDGGTVIIAGIGIIITIITVTGTAGDGGEIKQARLSRACFISGLSPRIWRDCCVLSYDLDLQREFVMKTVIGAACVAGALVFAGPVTIHPAAAASPQAKAQAAARSDATEFSAQRYYRRYPGYAYGYRPHYRPHYRPYYYARPTYYRPYPYYSPAPFTLGFGFGPYW